MRLFAQTAKFLSATVVLVSLCFAAQLRQLSMIELPGNAGFGDVALANGYIVISHDGDNSLDVFDPQKRRLVTQVHGMHDPQGIAVDDAAGKVYVANRADDTIAVVSSKDWKLADTIKLKDSPNALLLAPGGKNLFVANQHAQAVSLIDLGQGNQITAVAVGGSPNDMVFDPARKIALVTLEDTHEVIAVDPSLHIVARYPLVASMPTGIALDAQGRRIFVAVRDAVLELDADTGKEIKRVAAPAGVNSLWFDPAAGVLYTAGGGSVMRIKAAGGSFNTEHELLTKVRGHSLAYDAGRKMVFIPGGQEGHSKLLIVRSIDAVPAAPVQAPRAESLLR
ncbi:MAG TPA: YncE family protein [Terriglobales bacterium]|nr:YncE family protein [Terriglobales bacterium]